MLFYKKEYDYFLNKLEKEEHFRYSRFNDGEIMALTKLSPNKSNCDGHQYFIKMGEELYNALINYKYSENYLLESYDYWYDRLPIIKNTLDDLKSKNNDLLLLNDDFIRISHEREPDVFIKILNILKNKNVIIVGPDYLKALNNFFNFRYISVPLKNCYLEKNRIVNDINKIREKEKNIYYLFSASMAANVMIDYFDDDDNTYLDWGSVWDTFFVSNKYNYIRKRSTSNLDKYKEIYKDYLI